MHLSESGRSNTLYSTKLAYSDIFTMDELPRVEGTITIACVPCDQYIV